MKILILAPYYAPNLSPRAHRWTSIAEYWAEQGHDVHVISSKNKAYQNVQERNKVIVHRTGFNSLKEVLYHFSKNEVKRGEAQQKKQNAGKKGVVLQWINDKILRNIYFPDDAFMWYSPAKRKMNQLLNESHFDLLISSSVPFTAHLVALNAKKNHPDLKWIADTGDPFAFQPLHPMNNYFFYGKLNKKLEAKVAEKADFITLTNEGAKKMYAQIFPLQKEKLKVIPPVLRTSKNKYPERRTEDFQELKTIKIAYFGSFFRQIREPKPVLNYFSDLLKQYPDLPIELHFYGNIFENFLKDFSAFPILKNRINIHGLIESKAVLSTMEKIDFLLNIGNITNFQLPSKSVDYIVSGKPILNFISIEDDTFSQFFSNYNLIANFRINEAKMDLKKLKTFIENNRGKKEKESLINEMARKFGKEQIAESYLSLAKI